MIRQRLHVFLFVHSRWLFFFLFGFELDQIVQVGGRRSQACGRDRLAETSGDVMKVAHGYRTRRMVVVYKAVVALYLLIPMVDNKLGLRGPRPSRPLPNTEQRRWSMASQSPLIWCYSHKARQEYAQCMRGSSKGFTGSPLHRGSSTPHTTRARGMDKRKGPDKTKYDSKFSHGRESMHGCLCRFMSCNRCNRRPKYEVDC